MIKSADDEMGEDRDMIETMRAELAELSAKLERRKKIEAMLQSLQREEEELMQREATLKAVLLKEEADVERLGRTTATSILYSILGRKEDKLREEDREAYAARLKYDSALGQLDDCKSRQKTLYLERDSLSDCTGEYERIYGELQELLREDPAYAEQLCDLERRRGESVSQIKELDEAILAGDAVMNQIQSIESSLDSAEGWGTWDLLGGGLLSDLAKHSRLDEAQNGIEYLQVLLSRFHSELADISVNANFEPMNVDGFLRFADYFFDGLIADWTVLSRIHDSQERIWQFGPQVKAVLTELSSIKASRMAEKAAIEEQIDELVTQS
ncbi:MAG TPA: hypothetical protein VN381_00095 [Anaerovoracaceae bacterium]|nr:hypothetical protein [Anaerovoracaceae bacterium]